ncbi:hypothetical protein SGRA_4104 [Saprospira grandis str. Lewin]|uniref:Uncharacterized protein n=1 Tax=Saprospira grandis (strain Lewin) TaxID=984262 RepID=H6L7E7_SAPGL|nr:hypothetical protein SGRA_4104 [Saprospira grandis str. Lewin]
MYSIFWLHLTGRLQGLPPSAGATFRGSLLARPCAGFARLVWPLATPAHRLLPLVVEDALKGLLWPFGLRPWRLCRYLQPKGRSHFCWALVFLAAAA